MSFFIHFLLLYVGGGISLIVIIMIIVGAMQGNREQALKASISKMPNFDPLVTYVPAFKGTSIALDTGRRRIGLSPTPQHQNLFSYDDMLAVEVLRNGNTVTKTSRGSQLARAAVGAALAGPAGMLLGGLTAKQTQVSKTSRLSLKIYTKDGSRPFYEVDFLSTSAGFDSSSSLVVEAEKQMSIWYGRLQAIVQAAD